MYYTKEAGVPTWPACSFFIGTCLPPRLHYEFAEKPSFFEENGLTAQLRCEVFGSAAPTYSDMCRFRSAFRPAIRCGCLRSFSLGCFRRVSSCASAQQELLKRCCQRMSSAIASPPIAAFQLHTCQMSCSSVTSLGHSSPASSWVAASMRWEVPLACHTSTACSSGISSQPSWAPLA